MRSNFRFGLALCLLSLTSGQYQDKYQVYQPHYSPDESGPAPIKTFAADPQYRPSTPSPVIVSHKQALSHDGAFNFAFAADNGLQQGETISPDGTRSGAYSYVDPEGKKITVKYTAGKEGFRILQGDHIPRVPQEHQQPAQPQQQYQPQPAQPQILQQPHKPQQLYTSVLRPQYPKPKFFRNFHAVDEEEDNGQYRESYEKPNTYERPAFTPAVPDAKYQPYKNQNTRNAVAPEPDYIDEPGKPHSFGNGYSFEFSG